MKSHPRAVILLALCAALGGGCSDPVTRQASNTSRLNSRELQAAVFEALSDQRTEDAVLLFLAQQVRLEVDQQVFSPKAQRDYGVINLETNGVDAARDRVEPAAESDPAAYARAVERFASWSPDVGADYRPSWNHQTRLSEDEAAVIAKASHQRALAVARSKVKLLADAEYIRLTKIVREAEAIERAYGDVINKAPHKAPKELEKEYHEAWQRKEDAWIERREIEFKLSPETRWHVVAGWKAEDYFDDPQVIALCRAVEANDVAEMERLIAAGADVNEVGKQGMTPLLWAYPDRKYERFRCLLEHGANPNVRMGSDFSTGGRPFHPLAHAPNFDPNDGGCEPGRSVTSLAARVRAREIEYLRLVLEHGGDPNFKETDTELALLNIAAEDPPSEEKVALLLAKGADVNHVPKYRRWPPVESAVLSNRYSLALKLLKAGADPTGQMLNVARSEKEGREHFLPQTIADFDALVKWLEEHGQSLEKARDQIESSKN